jgi:triphosphoribosyl-dephospho-CoA synthetase
MQDRIAQCITLACLLEVTAPKPGNVHRGADFDDLTFADFLVSGVTIGPILATAAQIRVGQAILKTPSARTRTWGWSCCWRHWPRCLLTNHCAKVSTRCCRG